MFIIKLLKHVSAILTYFPEFLKNLTSALWNLNQSVAGRKAEVVNKNLVQKHYKNMLYLTYFGLKKFNLSLFKKCLHVETAGIEDENGTSYIIKKLLRRHTSHRVRFEYTDKAEGR